MDLSYLLIDVFTSRPFGGSRLYLFPDGDDLPDGLMQKVAQELGAGETAFIMRATQPQRARLRVFTPSVEIPFGGHSVLGATFALDHLGRRPGESVRSSFVWELEAGRYQVDTAFEDGAYTYGVIQDHPEFMGQYFHRDKVAQTLGLDEDDIAITGLPCEVVSTGLPIHVVPVASLDAMARISLRRKYADAIARDLGFGDLFVFTCETEGADVDVHCRMFAPHFGIPEDPASGAATGALAAYLIKHRLVKVQDPVRIVSEQGMEMGRPSRIIVEAAVRGGRAVSIKVGGQCVLVGSGTIHVS
ncbi:PhzF family phenazine biosynthesis protein [bacterium]|nr:PhzF family phenazine biosynthesis protein [bacterium]PIV81713.1 MAG: hypothetical protein COW53_02885 [bacterium CG17_big_fil_post_rev_8_21_14_2_50_64_8]PJA76965.1 MAG: hypothetical protein CO151_01200 [bacterium CG_4_9_14_3_um_filter_65_15]